MLMELYGNAPLQVGEAALILSILGVPHPTMPGKRYYPEPQEAVAYCAGKGTLFKEPPAYATVSVSVAAAPSEEGFEQLRLNLV